MKQRDTVYAQYIERVIVEDWYKRNWLLSFRRWLYFRTTDPRMRSIYRLLLILQLIITVIWLFYDNLLNAYGCVPALQTLTEFVQDIQEKE